MQSLATEFEGLDPARASVHSVTNCAGAGGCESRLGIDSEAGIAMSPSEETQPQPSKAATGAPR